MVDGAAMLREIESHPGAPVMLSHEQGLAIARTLAGLQSMARGQERLGIALPTIGEPKAAVA